MKSLLVFILIIGFICCKKEEVAVPVAPVVKTCYECSGFPLSPDTSIYLGCFATKREAMDSAIPEYSTSEAVFDEHCKKK